MKVAVVGLGIVGLSICARLALAGHEVFGFDQFEPMHTEGSSHGDTRIMRLTPGEGEIYVSLARRSAEKSSISQSSASYCFAAGP